MRRSRIVSLAGAAAVAAGALLAVALPSQAAGSLTATYNRVQEGPGAYFQGQYTLANGTSSPVTPWTLTFTPPPRGQLHNRWGANGTPQGQPFTATPPR